MAGQRPRQAVILAGGRGMRLRPLTDHVPKHMIRFHGRPFLEWLIEMLREQGFARVLLLLGYLPEVTQRHFGDGERAGVAIDYVVTPSEVESGNRLRKAAARLEDAFVLMYCDNYWPLRFHAMWKRFSEQRGQIKAQMTVYGNPDGYSRDNVAVAGGRIERYDRTRTHAGLRGVDIGFVFARPDLVERIPAGNTPVEAAWEAMAGRGELAAWVTGHRYYGVGSRERFEITRAFLSRPKAVLLDRDGVLNRRPAPGEYVRTWADWEWIRGSREGLRLFRNLDFRTIVISNQAGVSRGAIAVPALREIDRRMKQEAAAAGGGIDASYYCPHHWDAGCACRKPEPGMLWQAQRDFHLDLSRTWFVGDDERDARAAERAGCLYAAATPAQTLEKLAGEIARIAPRELQPCAS